MKLYRVKYSVLGIFICSFNLVFCQKDNSNNQIKKNQREIEKAKLQLDLADSYTSTYPDSVKYYTSKALKIGLDNGDIRTQSRSYAILGKLYQIQEKFKESTEYYLKSIELSEQHNDQQTLGASYNGLGMVYFYLNDLDKANYYIQKSLKVYLELNNYVSYALISSNLATLYFYKGEYRKSIQSLLETEKNLVKYKQTLYLPSLYNSLGGNYRMLSIIDSAKFYYEKSLDMSIRYDVVDNIITGYFNLGDLAYLNKRYSEAIFYFKKAETEAEIKKRDVSKLVIYSSLSENYELLGDYKNAFIYKEKQFELNKSIFEIEKRKSIEELEIKYESTKKEKEIQKQKRLAEQSKLIAQQKQSTFNLILFIVILAFILVVFTFFYLAQRKRAKHLLEQEKMRLFENIVHEIRTPLTLINGPLQLIKKEIDANNHLGEHVQLIENNTEKLVRLVNELLDTSKLERGKYIPAFEYGDINPFIDKLIVSFEREAKNKNITIEFEPLRADVLHAYPLNVIEKVVNNLVSNAIKYCPNSRTVKITLNLIDNSFVITVTDNGLGIPKKEQKRIFKRFYRLKVHNNYAGTGIGLSLVKELVELVNGTITVESIPNSGTNFQVTIPINLSEKPEEQIEIDENKPYLLLVEDDHEIVKFVSGLFRNEFNVITAYNGDEGVKKINALLPDVVLTDIMMPIKDGIELIQEIKSSELTSHIPVVVFSAKASLESRLEGLKHGADAYLTKPFNTDELILTVQNLLNTNKSAQQEFQQELKKKKSFEERTKSKNEYVNEMISFVVQHLEDVNYSVNELSNDMCISRSQLHRKLKVLTGFSSTNFIRMVRLEKAKDLLESNWGNVTEIAYNCGFSSQSYFTKSFTEYFGQNPTFFIGKD